MSNRVKFLVIFLIGVIVVYVLSSFLCSSIVSNSSVHEKESFIRIYDKPIVNVLDDYYKLTTEGHLLIDDRELYLSDLSWEDRRMLQLMLRTP